MAAQSMNEEWSLRIPEEMMQQLREHLFPGDHDEHGAVIGASVLRTTRGMRLLARHLFLAEDGLDYVAGQRGYRMLTASFVTKCALACANEGLAYLPIHCHGGTTSVGFSGDDMASHRRGYPALLDLLGGPPVVALVFAEQAVAGDVWLPGGTTTELAHVDVVGLTWSRLTPQPPPKPLTADSTYDRQARLFGDRGQAILAGQKVSIIGLGGAGALISEYLARLGVGHIIAIDPDRVDLTNLPRLVGARRWDARWPLVSERCPRWLRDFAAAHATPKVTVARRVARKANPHGRYDAIQADITLQSAVEQLVDCDYLFLAADTMQARLVVNALIHQYLIPGVQVGAKVQIGPEGEVTDVFSVVRPLIPGQTCLWCNGLISPTRLAEEAASEQQRHAQRYVPEVVAPSVITLNAVASSHAVDDYLFHVTGMAGPRPLRWRKFRPTTGEVVVEVPRRDSQCSECVRRLGGGLLLRLPTAAA